MTYKVNSVFETTSKGIASIISGGESERVEFERMLPPEAVIARALTAFANTSGGILLVGVDDDGAIIGLTDGEVAEAIARLQAVSYSLLGRNCNVGTVEVDGKSVVYVSTTKIPEYLAPVVTSEGRAYRRKGFTNIGIDLGTTNSSVIYSPSVGPRKISIFVAMSFRIEEEPALVDYFRAMQRAIEYLNVAIELRRVDLAEGDFEISQKIMDEIDMADVVIADLTLNSRNVYFELGYARGRKRRIVQTARKGTVLEFDIRNWRTIFYRNATELEEKLVEEFKNLWDELKDTV